MTPIPPHHLALFLPALPGGGAEKTLLNLITALAEQGHQVDLVLVKAQGALLARVPANIQIVDLRARRTLTSLLALRRYLRQARPDTLLTALHGNLVALWATRRLGFPLRLVISERNMLSKRMAHYSRWRRLLIRHLVRLCYPWADGIVVVSEQVATDLAHLTRIPQASLTVIDNPVVTPAFIRQTQEALDHPWFQPGQPPVILAVGRLHRQKDYPTLLRAFKGLIEQTNARLLILGEGSERSALQMLVGQLGLERQVSLPGHVANPYPYMKQAALFVLPSRWEGLPSVLVEALYCGCPIIATDCPGGTRQILKEGAYGRLIPVGDVPALTTALKQALITRPVPPPPVSWHPFRSECVLTHYRQILFGDPDVT